MDKIMYRDEDIYGSGINDILNVITYEVYELGNTDILEYCLDHYVKNETLENKFKNMIDNLEDYSELQVAELVQDLIKEINYQTKSDLKYCLWLASEQAVKDLYDGSNINAYYTSDVILSDLGYDGILFAYETEPLPIK